MSSAPPTGWPSVSRAMPPAASATHTASRQRREPTSATVSGPLNSIAATIPCGTRAIAP